MTANNLLVTIEVIYFIAARLYIIQHATNVGRAELANRTSNQSDSTILSASTTQLNILMALLLASLLFFAFVFSFLILWRQ